MAAEEVMESVLVGCDGDDAHPSHQQTDQMLPGWPWFAVYKVMLLVVLSALVLILELTAVKKVLLLYQFLRICLPQDAQFPRPTRFDGKDYSA